MSKKILSLALAVVMLFSICAVAVSAVNGDGTEIITPVFTSDAKVGAPAGTTVKVTYTIDLPVDELQMCIGNLAIGYNSDAYTYVSRTWGDDFGQYMKSTAAVTTTDTISTNILKKANANDTAKGYNKAIQVQMLYDGTNATASKGFPVYDNQVIFTLEFVTKRTITENDVIGIVEGAYGQSFCKICYFDGTKIGTYNVANIVMTQAAAAPSAATVEYDVYKLSAPRKHSNGDGTNTVAVFFAFDSIAPDFNTAGTSQFISAISATVTATSGSQSITVESDPIKYVYDLGEGEYGFRVILKNVPDAADITVVPAVTTTDSATYDVETVSFNVADATAA